jgi:hypothetical protein
MSKKKSSKQHPLRGRKVGDVTITQTYKSVDRNGNDLGLFWFVVPEGTTREQDFETQQHHGPFLTDAMVNESQRITLFGEQCELTEGGMWDPNWNKLQ